MPQRSHQVTLTVTSRALYTPVLSAERALWSTARRRAWDRRFTHPEPYFYDYIHPAFSATSPLQSCATNLSLKRFSVEEHARFLAALRRCPQAPRAWGAVALLLPGRTGAECRRYFHRIGRAGFITFSGAVCRRLVTRAAVAVDVEVDAASGVRKGGKKIKKGSKKKTERKDVVSANPVFLRRNLVKFVPGKLPKVDDKILRPVDDDLVKAVCEKQGEDTFKDEFLSKQQSRKVRNAMKQLTYTPIEEPPKGNFVPKPVLSSPSTPTECSDHSDGSILSYQESEQTSCPDAGLSSPAKGKERIDKESEKLASSSCTATVKDRGVTGNCPVNTAVEGGQVHKSDGGTHDTVGKDKNIGRDGKHHGGACLGRKRNMEKNRNGGVRTVKKGTEWNLSEGIILSDNNTMKPSHGDIPMRGGNEEYRSRTTGQKRRHDGGHIQTNLEIDTPNSARHVPVERECINVDVGTAERRSISGNRAGVGGSKSREASCDVVGAGWATSAGDSTVHGARAALRFATIGCERGSKKRARVAGNIYTVDATEEGEEEGKKGKKKERREINGGESRWVAGATHRQGHVVAGVEVDNNKNGTTQGGRTQAVQRCGGNGDSMAARHTLVEPDDVRAALTRRRGGVHEQFGECSRRTPGAVQGGRRRDMVRTDVGRTNKSAVVCANTGDGDHDAVHSSLPAPITSGTPRIEEQQEKKQEEEEKECLLARGHGKQDEDEEDEDAPFLMDMDMEFSDEEIGKKTSYGADTTTLGLVNRLASHGKYGEGVFGNGATAAATARRVGAPSRAERASLSFLLCREEEEDSRPLRARKRKPGTRTEVDVVTAPPPPQPLSIPPLPQQQPLSIPPPPRVQQQQQQQQQQPNGQVQQHSLKPLLPPMPQQLNMTVRLPATIPEGEREQGRKRGEAPVRGAGGESGTVARYGARRAAMVQMTAQLFVQEVGAHGAALGHATERAAVEMEAAGRCAAVARMCAERRLGDAEATTLWDETALWLSRRMDEMEERQAMGVEARARLAAVMPM